MANEEAAVKKPFYKKWQFLALIILIIASALIIFRPWEIGTYTAKLQADGKVVDYNFSGGEFDLGRGVYGYNQVTFYGRKYYTRSCVFFSCANIPNYEVWKIKSEEYITISNGCYIIYLNNTVDVTPYVVDCNTGNNPSGASSYTKEFLISKGYTELPTPENPRIVITPRV